MYTTKLIDRLITIRIDAPESCVAIKGLHDRINNDDCVLVLVTTIIIQVQKYVY